MRKITLFLLAATVATPALARDRYDAPPPRDDARATARALSDPRVQAGVAVLLDQLTTACSTPASARSPTSRPIRTSAPTTRSATSRRAAIRRFAQAAHGHVRRRRGGRPAAAMPRDGADRRHRARLERYRCHRAIDASATCPPIARHELDRRPPIGRSRAGRRRSAIAIRIGPRSATPRRSRSAQPHATASRQP